MTAITHLPLVPERVLGLARNNHHQSKMTRRLNLTAISKLCPVLIASQDSIRVNMNILTELREEGTAVVIATRFEAGATGVSTSWR